MHVIIVRWRIKPEHVAAFEAEMRAHVAATRRTEPGCLQFDVAADKSEPRTYHLFEVYADDKALAEHAKSPTLAKIREKIGIWVEERTLHNATLWPRAVA
jgi:(4S)-4-hydroxy-5-phosphonooxypentane-2,3-dione isomerase